MCILSLVSVSVFGPTRRTHDSFLLLIIFHHILYVQRIHCIYSEWSVHRNRNADLFYEYLVTGYAPDVVTGNFARTSSSGRACDCMRVLPPSLPSTESHVVEISRITPRGSPCPYYSHDRLSRSSLEL